MNYNFHSIKQIKHFALIALYMQIEDEDSKTRNLRKKMQSQ